MRSSLGSMRSNPHSSSINGHNSLSTIKLTGNNIVKESKFMIVEEVPNYQKFFNDALISQKQLSELKKIGYHHRKFQNNDIYYGQCQEQKPHGQGIYIYWSLATDLGPYFYKGNFQNGEFHGFGKLCKIISQREAVYVYQGYWKSGKREGNGRENYNQQGTVYYQGGWSQDQRTGQGILIVPDGNYEGNWGAGMMNGQGTLTLDRGPLRIKMTDIWINDDISKGRIQYFSKANNQIVGEYQGGIKNLMREGEGIYRCGNVQIQGNFYQDELQGYSTLKNTTNNSQYTIKGQYTQPKLQDLIADIKYSNSDRYEGMVDINNNIVTRTKGKYHYANGKSVDGVFDDNQNGELKLRK